MTQFTTSQQSRLGSVTIFSLELSVFP